MDKLPFYLPEPEAEAELDPLVLSLAMLTAARDVKMTADTALEWVRLAVTWGEPARVQALLEARGLQPGRSLAISSDGEIGRMDSMFFRDLRELDPCAAAAVNAIGARGGTPVLFLQTLPYLVLELGAEGFADPAQGSRTGDSREAEK
ncbi:MAG TPA: hypothetical protein VNI01_16700 [Elusimicrobiota bacterium]|jgi:hypothetical protein|nr:hypothetical protein [Elusimicrobiota bacterium]